MRRKWDKDLLAIGTTGVLNTAFFKCNQEILGIYVRNVPQKNAVLRMANSMKQTVKWNVELHIDYFAQTVFIRWYM
jgi:hypothetical protein